MSDQAAARQGPPARAATHRAPIVLDSGEELNPYRWIILIGLITATVLEVLDTTIVNVALPQIAGNLGATAEEIGWVATGYILSNVVVLPMTAWLSSRFGRKRYLVGSILLFIGASFLCGTSRTLQELVLWRVAQGAGGAALLSTAQSTLREIFPREQQGTVQATFILGVIVAPTVGPTLGGWITDNYSWPWIFFVNVPIGIISAAIVGTFLSDSRHRVSTVSVDWWGIGLLAVGLGALQYVLEEGNQNDWFEDATITRLAVVSAAALVALVWWEMSPRNAHPIVSFRVFANRDLAAATLLFVLLGFGLYGGVFLFPLFTQNILGFTPTETGIVLMPGGIASGTMAILCGRLLNGARPLVSPVPLILIGLGLFTFSMWDLGHLSSQSGPANVQAALIVRGAGLGLLFTPINLAAFRALRGVAIAQGASMMNLARQLGGSFGIALLGSYVTRDAALHYSAVTASSYPENPIFAQSVAAVTARLAADGYAAPAAHQAALKVLAGTMQREALTMAYNDAFLLIGLGIVLVSPAVFLLAGRRASGAGSPSAAGH